MPGSTITLQQVNDYVAAQGVPTPLSQPAGYDVALALDLFNDVRNDLLSERFNWKWNRATAPTWYTNGWQQDYPQLGNVDIAWLEDGDQIDINNTAMPKPLWNVNVLKQLSRTSAGIWRPASVCWSFNKDLSFGTWPGANTIFYPLVAPPPTAKNPIMSMIDANGNRMILTSFGTTGPVAPYLPPDSPEGTTAADGSVVWTVVDPLSVGFRLNALPGGTGPVWQMIIYYQRRTQLFTDLQNTLDPIPDDQAFRFRRGYKCYCLSASPNPGDRARFADVRMSWLNDMQDVKKDDDKELNAYSLIATIPGLDRDDGWERNVSQPV